MQKITVALFLLVAAFFSIQAFNGDVVWGAGFEYAPNINSAEITSSPMDIGNARDCFDGDINTIARSANVNPAWVQVEFSERIEVYKVKVSLGKPGYYDIVHNWWLESADNQSDLNNKTGSYKKAVLERSTHVDNAWDEVILQETVKGKIWRFTAEKTLGDDYVYIPELKLLCYYYGIKLDVMSFLKTKSMEVKGSKAVSDNIAKCFDEDTSSSCSFDNPANILVDFKDPRLIINRIRVFVGTGQNSETDTMKIEAADNIEDLKSKKNSYKLIYDRKDEIRREKWLDVYINIPLNKRFWSFSVNRLDAVSDANISGIEFWVDQRYFDYPPRKPESLKLIERKETKATLSWSPSLDSTGFVLYNIFRDGIKIASTRDVRFTDESLSAGRAYSYSVQAYNISRKYSENSSTVVVNPFAASVIRPKSTETASEVVVSITVTPEPTEPTEPTGSAVNSQSVLPQTTPTKEDNGETLSSDSNLHSDIPGKNNPQKQIKENNKSVISKYFIPIFILVLVIFLACLISMIVKLKKRMRISQKKRETELNAIKQLLIEEKTEHVIELLGRKGKNKKD